MTNRVRISLPPADATALCESLAPVLAALNPVRILAADLAQAERRFVRLAAAPVTMLYLAAADAEELLAECDAVWHALDPAVAGDSALAGVIERFCQFRRLVDRACSVPPITATQSLCQEAA